MRPRSRIAKLLAAVALTCATDVASGFDWRVIVGGVLTDFAVWLVPNTPAARRG